MSYALCVRYHEKTDGKTTELVWAMSTELTEDRVIEALPKHLRRCLVSPPEDDRTVVLELGPSTSAEQAWKTIAVVRQAIHAARAAS